MLTLKDLLNEAIIQEQNSQKLYQFGADIARDEESKQFFRQLVKEEKHHEEVLYNIRETGLYKLDAPIEDPEILTMVQTSHGSNELNLDRTMPIEHLLEMAMQREQTAKLRYGKAAQLSREPEVRELLENLAREEEGHRLRVEKYYKIHRGLFGKEI